MPSHRPLTAIAAACLLTLPLTARAAVSYRAQGYAGAHDGLYGVYYGNFSQEISSPAFQNLLSLGRAKLSTQSHPFTTTPTPPSLNLVADPGPFEFIVGDDRGNVFSYHGQGAATASASISGTSLHATASVAGQISPLSYTWIDDDGHPHTAPNYITFHGVASALVAMSDVLTISSTSLPAGAPVTLRLTATLHSDVHDEQGHRASRANSFASAYFSLGNDSLSLTDGDGHRDPHLPPDQRTQTLDIQARVGDRLEIYHALSVSTEGLVHFNGDPSVHNYASAGNTTLLYLDPLTPLITLSTDSGLSYASPLPEPSTLLLTCTLSLLPLTRRPTPHTTLILS